MINGIHHTSMTTVDIDRMADFYGRVLGFEVAWKPPALDLPEGNGTLGVVVFRTGTSFVEAVQRMDFPVDDMPDVKAMLGTPGYKHICIDVSDIHAEAKRLTDAGVRFMIPPTDAGAAESVAAYIYDPDGNLIELIDVVDKSARLHLSRSALQQPRTNTINGVHHTSLTTANFDRMIDFYTRLLGFEIAWNASVKPKEGAPSLRFMTLRTGTSYMEVVESMPMPDAPNVDIQRMMETPGYKHFCLDVEDIDREFERLSAAGVKFIFPPTRRPEVGGLVATYAYDPDGNLIELVQVLDRNGAIHLSRAGRLNAAA